MRLLGFLQAALILHPRTDTLGLDKPGRIGKNHQNEQNDGQGNTKSQGFCHFLGLLLPLVLDHVEQRGTQACNNQQKSDNDSNFNHRVRCNRDKMSIFGHSMEIANRDWHKIMHFRLFRRDFKFSLFYTTLYLLVLALLLSLGFWQLGRADEKRILIAQQKKHLDTVMELNSRTDDNTEFLRYRQISATGHYDGSKQFLIDNQIVKGKAGYFVMTPFILKNSDKAVLVNRGWLPANPDRNVLPDIAFKDGQSVNIKGRINTFPSVGLKLDGAEIPSEGWPSVVQLAEAPALSKKLGRELFSFQVELDPEGAEGYTRNWQKSNLMPPEKHIAYATQWFGLALTLSILFFWYSSKKRVND